DGRLPRSELAQRVEDQRLGPRVHGARRLVEDEDRRPREERADEAYDLALALGEVRAALADVGRESAREAVEDGAAAERLESRLRLGVRQLGPHEAQVVEHAA